MLTANGNSYLARIVIYNLILGFPAILILLLYFVAPIVWQAILVGLVLSDWTFKTIIYAIFVVSMLVYPIFYIGGLINSIRLYTIGHREKALKALILPRRSLVWVMFWLTITLLAKPT